MLLLAKLIKWVIANARCIELATESTASGFLLQLYNRNETYVQAVCKLMGYLVQHSYNGSQIERMHRPSLFQLQSSSMLVPT